MKNNGIALITAKRQRQIEKHGWSPEHDDQHEDGELCMAALVYASPFPVKVFASVIPPCSCRSAGECTHLPMKMWVDPTPWDACKDVRKQGDRIEALANAGALIAAEIDRLLRQQSPPEPGGAR